MQQKVLRAEVQKETGRWKSRWKIRDLLADGRCGQAVLDLPSSTDMGRLVPPLEESDVGSEVSEWELQERWEREEEREVKAEELGAEGELGGGAEPPRSYHPPRSWHRRKRIRGWATFPLLFPLCFYSARFYFLSGQAWAEGKRGACNEPPPRGQRTGKMDKMYAAIV